MGCGRNEVARGYGWRAGAVGRPTPGNRWLSAAAVTLLLVLAGSLLPIGTEAQASSFVGRGPAGDVPSALAVRLSPVTDLAAQPRFVLESLRARRVAKPGYVVDVLYPRLTGISTSAAARINARIVNFVDETASSFEHGVKTQPSHPYAVNTGPSTLIGSVTSDFDSGQLGAVSFAEYTYISGAAHGVTVDTTFNFDAGTGRLYRLADLFAPSARWLVALSQASRRALPKLVGSLEMKSWIDSGTAPKESNFSAWSLTPWGLQITFGDYQVAAYAAGTPQITVPYASLSAIARPAGPIAIAAGLAAALRAGPSRMPLLPEVSQPASGECYQPLNYAAGGFPSPFRCSGGRINVVAWDSFTQFLDGAGTGEMRMLALAGTPSLATVRAVMCADLGPGVFTNANTEIVVERLAAEYHGWRFSTPPTAGFPGFCHRVK